MNLEKVIKNGVAVAVVTSDEKIITDTQSALDLMMTVKYEADTDRIAIDKKAVCEDFFILSTGLAGEILQKFVNYGIKCAIYGDYSKYTSKPLKDFIFESNRGKDIFFTSDRKEAVSKLQGM